MTNRIVDGVVVPLTDTEEAEFTAANAAAVLAEPAIKWASIRSKRDALLTASDYTQVADAPGDKAAWATYRETLRDLPASQSDPDDIVFPTEPT